LLANEVLQGVWNDYTQLEQNNNGELCPRERSGRAS